MYTIIQNFVFRIRMRKSYVTFLTFRIYEFANFFSSFAHLCSAVLFFFGPLIFYLFGPLDSISGTSSHCITTRGVILTSQTHHKIEWGSEFRTPEIGIHLKVVELWYCGLF